MAARKLGLPSVPMKAFSDGNIAGFPHVEVPKHARLDKSSLPHISVTDMYGVPDGERDAADARTSFTAAAGHDEQQPIKLPMEFAAFELLVSAAFELLHSDISHLEKIFVKAMQNLENLSPLASEELHVLKNQVGCRLAKL